MPQELEYQYLERIFSRFGEKKRAEVQKNPKPCLLSLLTCIDKYVDEGWTMLKSTVEMGTFSDNIEAAKQKLEEVAHS